MFFDSIMFYINIFIFGWKINCFKWDPKENQELKGKVTILISSIKSYDDLWFKIPHNDYASSSYLPLALQIKGEILEKEGEGVPCDKKMAYFLIPEPDFEELHIELKPGDKIQLWLTDRRKCFKFDKLDR